MMAKKFSTQIALIVGAVGEFSPKELTDIIQIDPTKSWKKGDEIPDYPGLITLQKKFTEISAWKYSTGYIETLYPKKLFEHLEAIFKDKAVALKKYSAEKDLKVVLEVVVKIVDERVPDIHFNKTFLKMLNDLGGEIDMDMYAFSNSPPGEEDEEEDEMYKEFVPNQKYSTQIALILSVSGEFNPKELTDIIQIDPTDTWKKGDETSDSCGSDTGNKTLKKTSGWEYSTGYLESRYPEELFEQLEEIFKDKVLDLKRYIDEKDLKVVLEVAVDIVDEWAPGIHFEKSFLKMLNDLGAEIAMDMSAFSNDPPVEEPQMDKMD